MCFEVTLYSTERTHQPPQNHSSPAEGNTHLPTLQCLGNWTGTLNSVSFQPGNSVRSEFSAFQLGLTARCLALVRELCEAATASTGRSASTRSEV